MYKFVYIQPLINALERSKITYRVIDPQCPEIEGIIDWVEENFDVTNWGRINWLNVREHQCCPANNLTEQKKIVVNLLNEISSKDNVVVTWTNALKPSISLALSDIECVVDALLDTDWDTWIICKSGKWCIEVYHEGEVCIGYTKK